MILLVNEKTYNEILIYKESIHRSITSILQEILSSWFITDPIINPGDKLKLERGELLKVHCSFTDQQRENINLEKIQLGLTSWEMVDMAWEWFRRKKNERN